MIHTRNSRNTLRLVEDHLGVIAQKEAFGILVKASAHIWILEAQVLVVRKRIPHEGGLAALARTGDGHDGILPRQL